MGERMSVIQLSHEHIRGKIPPIAPSAGCFIAGGAVRRWFGTDEQLSDIDVFAPAKENHAEFLKDKTVEIVDDNKHAETYLISGVKVQLIKFYHPTVDALFEAFDYNVCQFAWTEAGIFASHDAVIGVLRGHLSVAKISKEFAVDSLRRAFKYQRRGYEPCAGTLRDIAKSLSTLTQEEIESQVQLSPKGGSRIIRFD